MLEEEKRREGWEDKNDDGRIEGWEEDRMSGGEDGRVNVFTITDDWRLHCVSFSSFTLESMLPGSFSR